MTAIGGLLVRRDGWSTPASSLGDKGNRKSQVPRIDHEAGVRNREGRETRGRVPPVGCCSIVVLL